MEEIFDSESMHISVLITPNMANFSDVMHSADLLKLLG